MQVYVIANNLNRLMKCDDALRGSILDIILIDYLISLSSLNSMSGYYSKIISQQKVMSM